MIYDDYFKNIIGGNINSPEYYVSTYENKTYEPRQVNSSLPGYNYSSTNEDFEDDKILELYPDIYRVVSPMVDKLLEGKDTSNINESILVNWTVEIYDALETDEVFSKTTLNLENPTNTTNNRNVTNTNKLNNYPSTTNLNQRLNNNINNNTNNNLKNNPTYESETTSTNITMKNNIIDSQTTTRNNITDSRTVNSKEDVLTNTEPKTIDVVSRYRNYRNPLLRDLIRILILNKLYGNNRPPRPRPRPYQDFRPTFMPIPNYNEVNTEVFKPYANYSKTYFDTPYPEEG